MRRGSDESSYLSVEETKQPSPLLSQILQKENSKILPQQPPQSMPIRSYSHMEAPRIANEPLFINMPALTPKPLLPPVPIETMRRMNILPKTKIFIPSTGKPIGSHNQRPEHKALPEFRFLPKSRALPNTRALPEPYPLRSFKTGFKAYYENVDDKKD